MANSKLKMPFEEKSQKLGNIRNGVVCNLNL